MKRIKVYYGMVDKEKMELMNLRKRVKDQREEIKRLQDENNRLRNGIAEIGHDLKQLREYVHAAVNSQL